MILLIILTSVVIAMVTIFQYIEQTEENNIKRFNLKEESAKQDIEITLQRTSFPVTTENIKHIFQDKIYDISRVHELTIFMYDIPGCLLKSSIPIAFPEKQDSLLKSQKKLLSVELVNKLANDSDHNIITSKTVNGVTYKSSFSYITDTRFKHIGILELRIAEDSAVLKKELKDFLERLFLVYLLMFLIAIFLAYFISTYITKSIKTISEKIKETQLNKRNEKIKLSGRSSEINDLVKSYNNMIDQLEDSAEKLAKSEREQAWREMAKQVAHEIKNPLTPMRLSVQSFERNFDENDPEIKSKLKEYSETLIQQIDLMSSIASAFSNFAKMPKKKLEYIDIVDVIKHSLDIFTENYISFNSSKEEILMNFDKSQLTRIVTNLVKNARQAIAENQENKQIDVDLTIENNFIKIRVSDNGKGIAEEHKKRIFEPKFTTKTSGMGLGLPMIKNIIESYNGKISFNSIEGKGTVFLVELPLN